MISLDVNVDVHPQLQLFSILDHDDLQGRLLMSDYLVGGAGRLVVVVWGSPPHECWGISFDFVQSASPFMWCVFHNI